jgi:hypothetical protein
MMVSARMNYTGALLATSLAMRPRGAARSAMSGASLPAAKATECGVAGRNSINRPRTFPAAAALKECGRVLTPSRVDGSADTEPLSLDWRARV